MVVYFDYHVFCDFPDVSLDCEDVPFIDVEDSFVALVDFFVFFRIQISIIFRAYYK